MLYCTNVCISNVTIESSNGTGLTLYNTVGTVTMQYCTFNNNGVSLDKSSVGGGGLQIQFTYCTPGDSSCNKISPYYSSNARYNIIFNVFTGNIAHSTGGTLNNDNILLGRGGAILIALEGHSFNNIFNLLSTTITKGRAQAGGGIYLALHNIAQNNHININKCHITDTMATKDGGAMYIKLGDSIATVIRNNIYLLQNIIEHNKAMVKGGGVFLSIDSEVFISKNNITFRDSSFSNNRAQGGAALYLYSLIDNSMVLYLQISNMKFFNNIASFLSCPGTICIYKLQVIFSGSVILTSNHVSAIKLYNGTLVLDNNSHCIFESNIGDEGGAIALYNCSTIVLHNNTNLTFNDNSANIGGAIYSGECSLPMCFIQPHVIPEAWNVQLHFHYNTAHKYGNAMYIGSNVVSCWPPNVDCSSLSENVEIISKTFCWNTTWHYSPGNCYSNVDTSIVHYTSSVPVYYVYPGDELKLKLEFYDGQMKLSDFNETLNICIHGPASFNDAANIESDFYYSGSECSIYTYYYDQCPELKPVQNCSTLTQDESLSLYFAPNNNEDKCINSDTPNISLTINPVQCSSSGNVSVRFKICPFGFDGPLCLNDNHTYPSCEYDSSITSYYHSQCFVIEENSHIRCPGNESKDILTPYIYRDFYGKECKQATLCGIGSTITTEEGYCLSQYDNGTNIGIGMCPSGYANIWFTAVFSDLISPAAAYERNQQFCINSYVFDGADDTRLCGSCPPGTAVPITGNGILHCIKCASSEDDGLFLWYYILPLQFLPLTIMIVLIIVLDIKLVGGHITGYILYCQMLSLPFPQLLSTVVVPFTSMWNINFISLCITGVFVIIYFCSICITHTMRALGAISFWYVVAFYPLVLLLLLYVWIIMYERGWRMVVCITRPVHRLLARFWLKFDIHPSLIDSVAGIYILCFTQLAVTSLKILHFTWWESLTSDEYGLAFYYDGTLDYFKGRHALAGSFAIIVLIIFVILPMVYLLLYPFKYFQRFLDVCKLRRQFTDAVVDSLTGSFKNGSDNTYDYRFFAGLYLLLRIIIICLFYIPYTEKQYIMYALCGVVVVHGAAVTIFRPFRKNLHNFSNFILTVFLALNFGLLLTSSMLFLINSLTFSIPFLIISNSPFLLVFVYCIYKIVKKCMRCCRPRCKCKTNRQPHAPIYDDDDNDGLSTLLQQQNAISDFDADRMMNPNNYEERHFSNPWLQAQFQAEHEHEDPVSIPLSQPTADCDSNGSQSELMTEYSRISS